MGQLFVVKVAIFLVVQIVVSTFCIYRNKKGISYLAEILVLSAQIAMSLQEIKADYKAVIAIALAFLIGKIIVCTVIVLLRIWSFYLARDIARRKAGKYFKIFGKKRFIKFVSQVRKIKYGPRLKYGVPAMANKVDKKTGTRFDKRGFPAFKDLYFEMNLKRKDYNATRDVHFYRASKALYKRALEDKRFAKKFTKRELEIFSRGEVPKKYTWHHHQDKGRMQLVLTGIHSKVSHIGGFSIWGKKDK